MALSQTSVLKLYNTVIDDVISGVREAFLDEGVDEQVLQELKQIWENKLMSSKAVELNPDPPEPQPPQINTTKNSSSKSKKNANANATAQAAVAAAAAAAAAREPSPEIHQQPSPSEPSHILPHPSPPKPQPQPTRIQPPPQQMQHMQNMAVQQQIKQQPPQQLIPQQQQVANQPSTSTITMPDRQVSIQIKLPVHGQLPERLITVHVPASAIHGNQLHQLFTGPIITAAIGLPIPFATSLLQQHVNQTFEGLPGFTPVQVQPFHIVDSGANHMLQQQQLGIQGKQGNIAQLDGAAGDSSDDDFDEEEENDEIEDDNNDDDDDDDDDNNSSSAREEEPLNSEDDVTDDDPTDLFDTDNVVVCQYDKITRSRNKWKFYLKDGIMNLSGKDFVFQKANGDAEW